LERKCCDFIGFGGGRVVPPKKKNQKKARFFNKYTNIAHPRVTNPGEKKGNKFGLGENFVKRTKQKKEPPTNHL